MPTFLEAQDALLDYVNRPASEMREAVKRELNNAIRYAQRRYEFKLNERSVRVTYPLGNRTIDITQACDGIPRNWISAQHVASFDQNTGRQLLIIPHAELMAMMTKDQRTHNFSITDTGITSSPFGAFVAWNEGHFVFLHGKELGLFPTPLSDIPLLLSLTVWTKPLVEDNDTNFLLDECYDWTLLQALSRMHLYLKVDVRYQVTKVELEDAWQTVTTWDSQVRSGRPQTQ